MELRSLVLSLTAVLIGPLAAQDTARDGDEKVVMGLTVGASVAIRQAVARPDLAIVKSKLPTSLIKGDFGEALVGRYLGRGGEWKSAWNSGGKQGIDHVHIKMDSAGRIRDLMVTEVKYGSSQLKPTRDGIQMGPEWRAERLKGIAKRYRDLGTLWKGGRIATQKMPQSLQARQVLTVPMGYGPEARFWKASGDKAWKLDAGPDQLPKLLRNLDKAAMFFDAAGSEKIAYRARVLRATTEQGYIVLDAKAAPGSAKGAEDPKLPLSKRQRVPLKLSGGTVLPALTRSYGAALAKTYPELPRGEVERMARELAKDTYKKNLDFGGNRSASVIGRFSRSGGVIGAVAAGVVEVGSAMVWDGNVSAESLGWALGGGGVGAVIGTTTGVAVTNQILGSSFGFSMASQVASSLGLATSTYAANLIGSASGGGVATVTFAYLLYFTGQIDLATANRMTFAGVTGGAVGFASAAAATSLVATYGTAATGTAISTLSGAAAQSATMAAIGGGSVAAGGIVMATGVGVVVVGVSAAIMWGFSKYDTEQESKRLSLVYEHLSQHYGE